LAALAGFSAGFSSSFFAGVSFVSTLPWTAGFSALFPPRFSWGVFAFCLAAVAKLAPLKWANFALAFLAVQCLLNAFFSLKDLFFISAAGSQPTDAANMAMATGIPSLVWVGLWIIISLVMISVGMRLYASKGKKADDSLFVD